MNRFHPLILILIVVLVTSCNVDDPSSEETGGGTSSDSGESTAGSSTGVPTGTLTLNNGDTSTGSLGITVKLTASGNSNITHFALSETDATPDADSPLWNTIPEPSTTVTMEITFSLSASSGDHTVYGWVKNETGEIIGFSDSIRLNPTSLTAGLTINNNATYTASRNVSLDLSGLGPSHITAYEVSENASPSSYLSVSSPSISLQLSAVSFELSSGDGSKIIYLHLKDVTGTTTIASASITLDTTSPTGALLLDEGNKLTVDATVSAKITGSDPIGITGYYLSSGNTPPTASQTGWSSVTSSSSLTTTIDRDLTDLTGLSIQYLWLKDGAGNISQTISDGIEVARIFQLNGGSGDGQYTSIALDSSDRPFISFYEGSYGRLIVTSFVDGGFSSRGLGNTVADGTSDVGAGTSIAIDSNDNIHVAYRDSTNGKLKYVRNAGGSWGAPETIEDGGISPSIGIDSNGKVHISHLASNKVNYVTNIPGSWSSQQVISSGTSIFSSLAIGAGDSVHIAGTSVAPDALKYTASQNSWQVETITSNNGGGESLVLSITADQNNIIHIAYSDDAFMGIATNEGNGWSMSQIDSIGTQPCIATDSQGNVHVAYYDFANDDLKYATNYSGSWVTTVLDSSGDVGNYCDITIDANDRLHISYYDATNGDLKYATTAD